MGLLTNLLVLGAAAFFAAWLGLRFGRWLNRDPLEERGGLNLYAFCCNNPLVYVDKDGQAYFAVRDLDGAKYLRQLADLFGLRDDLRKKNLDPVHEQLFFEDAGLYNSIGWGNNGLMLTESIAGYRITDYGYDDCIMRIAVSKVGKPDHYQATVIGFSSKYNCQDYADDLRRKYREIENIPEVRCKCKKR